MTPTNMSTQSSNQSTSAKKKKNNIMKRFLNRFALALFIALTSMSPVQAAGGYSVTVAEGNVVLIKFDDIKSENAFVQLVDVYGEQLWSEVIKGATTFHKQFNLAQLPGGLYEIIMTDGDLVHTQEIKKEINKVYVINTSTITFLKPVTTLKNNKLTVAYPAGVSTLESVSFEADNGEVFFSDNVTYTDSFQKSYNLKKLEHGDYTVIVKTDQDIFYSTVTIK